jgi:hypothetical protein
MKHHESMLRRPVFLHHSARRESRRESEPEARKRWVEASPQTRGGNAEGGGREEGGRRNNGASWKQRAGGKARRRERQTGDGGQPNTTLFRTSEGPLVDTFTGILVCLVSSHPHAHSHSHSYGGKRQKALAWLAFPQFSAPCPCPRQWRAHIRLVEPTHLCTSPQYAKQARGFFFLHIW